MPVNAGAALFAEWRGGQTDQIIVAREACAAFREDVLTLLRQPASQECIPSHCS